MRVVRCAAGMAAAWDAFALNHPDSTFYHQIAWRDVIRRAYGWKAHYLACVEGEEIVGIAPLFEMRDLSLRRALVSLPFSNYGGVLALSPEAGAMLLREMRHLRDSCNAAYVCLKGQDIADGDAGDVLLSRTYCAPRIALADREEEMFRRLPGNLRRQVRKARKNGASVRIGGRGVLQPFLHVYYDNMRRFGTPCHRRRWFERVSEAFASDCLYLAVLVGQRAVAGGMVLLYRDRALLQHVVSTVEGRDIGANALFYWSLIAEAIGRDMTCLDCGRSRAGAGNWRFKMQWCAESVETPYTYLTTRKIDDEHPDNPKYAGAIRCWQKMPTAMTKVVGPVLRKHITT